MLGTLGIGGGACANGVEQHPPPGRTGKNDHSRAKVGAASEHAEITGAASDHHDQPGGQCSDGFDDLVERIVVGEQNDRVGLRRFLAGVLQSRGAREGGAGAREVLADTPESIGISADESELEVEQS